MCVNLLVNNVLFTDTMHLSSAYVRDHYFFKRSQYPQLNLIKMEPDAAHAALQMQYFQLHFIEASKVGLYNGVVQVTVKLN